MKLIYGTHNGAKLEVMRQYVRTLDIEIAGLPADMDVPPVDESGSNPLENAEIKARTFYQVLRRSVFSCDTGLFFDGVPAGEQPGTHVRRVKENSLTDEEMVAYYAALSRKYGGRLTARYRDAICLILDENHIYRSMDDSLSGEPFWLVDTPHPRRINGFPLDSLSVDPKTGLYYLDYAGSWAEESAIGAGLCNFFEHVLAELDHY